MSSYQHTKKIPFLFDLFYEMNIYAKAVPVHLAADFGLLPIFDGDLALFMIKFVLPLYNFFDLGAYRGTKWQTYKTFAIAIMLFCIQL